jgi:dihydroflavonol-4-reductase
MNLLVTGANGLLGNELCKQLAKDPSIHITALVRSIPATIQYPTINYVSGDILNFPVLSDVLRKNGIDTIVHCAATVSFLKKDERVLFETNVSGTSNIINAALQENVSRLIHISSVAAIGKPEKVLDSKEPVRIDETFKWTETPLNSNYAKSKYLAELEVWRGQAEGLKTVILNPSTILGTGELSRSSTQLFNYIYKGNRFITAGSINYIDVNDLIQVVKNILSGTIENERYIVSAGAVSYQQFFGLMADAMGKSRPNLKLGKAAVELLWRLEAVRSFLTGSKPLITKETSISARSNICFDSSKLKTKFNFTFTPLEDTIKRVCNELNLSQPTK